MWGLIQGDDNLEIRNIFVDIEKNLAVNFTNQDSKLFTILN